MESEQDEDMDILLNFRDVMDLVKSDPEKNSTKKYEEGLEKLEDMKDMASEEIEELGGSEQNLKQKAEETKENYGGDILPALNDLSKFTYENHPREVGEKREYFEATMVWALTAEEYLKRKKKYARRLKE